MDSPMILSVDDKDLDDAVLWAVIDSAAASHSSKSSNSLKYVQPRTTLASPATVTFPPSPPLRCRAFCSGDRAVSMDGGEVLQEHWSDHRLQNIARSRNLDKIEQVNPMAVVKHVEKTPPSMTHFYPSGAIFSPKDSFSVSKISSCSCGENRENRSMRHSLSGGFPSVALFKDYQISAMQILEKTDYTMVSGHPYIKKSGWRKISFYFNVSYEIKEKSIENDANYNVIRAEFVVRAHMQCGRFSDGWGSCERREKRFMKPNHDVPSTAETRAKNKACQDLLGIGEYQPGVRNAQG